MTVYECNACSAFEVTESFVPDCCSICGSTLVCVGGDTREWNAIEQACVEAAEAAYAGEGRAVSETRRAAVANCLLFAIAALILLASIGPSPAVMSACEQRHSADTCFAILNR